MAEAAVATKPPVAPPLIMPTRARKMIPLPERRFKEREFLQNQFAADVPAGTTMEELLTREFWAHVARGVTRRAKISVMTDDCRMYVELIVFSVGVNWLQVRPLPGSLIILDEAIASSSMADDYRLHDAGLHIAWQIIRVSDGRVVKGDGTLKTEDAARAWLRDYLNSQGLRNTA